jgi:predicted nuclease of restriction endonuclease-like RecB superfamily
MGEDYKEASKPLVEICNPGKGDGKSELTANIKQLKRQYHKKFITPLMQQMQAMVSSQSAKYSPIFEMLQMVSLQSFQRFPMEGERHLLLVSDLLHNTPELSLYKKLPSVEDFESSDYARRTFIELKNVQVDLYLLFNSPQFQTDSLMDFWEAYFEKTGANISSITPMPG